MKAIKFLCITAEDDNDNYIIENIIDNIKEKKVTLENLKALQKLKKDYKENFLKYIRKEVSNDALHELNKKVMEHARDLSAPEDPVFMLRRPEDAIFHKLLYLEAINNNFEVEIDKEEKIVFNLPQSILELLQSLVSNFYKKNFENVELQKVCDKEYKVTLERDYIKKNLAKSIMWLFVTKFIKKNMLKKEMVLRQNYLV